MAVSWRKALLVNIMFQDGLEIFVRKIVHNFCKHYFGKVLWRRGVIL